jgi:GR25 family glycosyltransferase involved in LPS biosynthesis
MRKSRFALLLLLLLVAAALVGIVGYFTVEREGLEWTPPRGFVINLDKDGERFQQFQDSHAASDMMFITRFSGTVGKDLESPETLLTEKAWEEVLAIEQRGHRTHHYQLSRGGIGCFTSHLKLMQRLVDDPEEKAYLIMEDDNHFFPNSFKLMKQAIQQAPKDWNILCGICHRVVGHDVSPDFQKVDGFWGLGGYVINREGALKVIKEVKQRKMDGQIDAFLSRMAQQDRIRIYAAKEPWFHHEANDSNIQTQLVEIEGQDPFVFDGYRV